MSNPTLLEKQLVSRILDSGPITFRDFMDAALYDDDFGYYNTGRPKIGRSGDYYTASNVHQVFGAVIGGVLGELLKGINASPDQPLTLVEFGAGTGQLAADILETIAREHPPVFERIGYLIVERSPAMISLQHDRLDRFGQKVNWSKLDDLKALCGGVLSNELVDALPVHRVRRHRGSIEEQFVLLEPGPGGSKRLGFGWSKPLSPRIGEYIGRMAVNLEEGQVVEVGLDAVDWLGRASRAVDRGFLLTLDYGDLVELLWNADRRRGTLRAFRQHRLVDEVLDVPGEQDLTASVNFTALIEYGKDFGLEPTLYQRQVDFLTGHGLLARIAGISDLRSRLAAKQLLVPGGVSDNFRVLVQRRLRQSRAADG
jgi:SAM-dependent MidA family methyltransferase